MTNLIVVVVLLCGAHDGLAGKKDRGGRMIGGENAIQSKVPFMVCIQRVVDSTWWQVCGGSIISPTKVLTACHCTKRETTTAEGNEFWDARSFRVIAGVANLNQSSDLQKTLVKKLIIHPECENTETAPFFNDIAIMVLKSPLVFNTYVQPLKVVSRKPKTAMARLRELQNSHATCIVTGWGTMDADQPWEERPPLQMAKFVLLPNEECQTGLCNLGEDDFCGIKLGKLKQFCAVGSHHARICSGESGGPIICNGFVYGLVSYSFEGCPTGFPSVYNSIEPILDMINAYA